MPEPLSQSWRERSTDHFDVARQRFFNPWNGTTRGLRDLVHWWMTADRRPWPAQVENQPHPPAPRHIASDEIGVTMVGHACLLVRMGDATLLTDPHFSTHAGAYGRFGAPRVRRPGLDLDALPAIDLVFVSHNHYDHLDVPSLRWLDEHRRPVVVTCLGLRRPLEQEGLRHVVELDWWESVEVGETTVTVTPAQHWSNRSMFDRCATLWGGCHVRHRDGRTVYFAGDSGYASCFTEIGARLGPPDVAMLPIGAYEPRWFMREHHMNPDDAVRAHLDLGARTSIAMHFGVFRLTDEGFDEPIRDLAAARRRHEIGEHAFRVVDVGESAVCPVGAR